MKTLPPSVLFFERGWLSSNNVLLRDSHQAILVDSGYVLHAEQTGALLLQVLAGQPLTTLFNTHLHSDHCGGNHHLQTLYPHLQTLIPPGHAPYVADWNPNLLTYADTGQSCAPFTHTGLLNHGDAFVIDGDIWEVHAAPGHDPHSVILFNPSHRLLISADALWENGFGVVFPELDGIDAFDEVDATLDLIERLNPMIVLPGHGKVFSDVPDAISRARSRLAQFRNSPLKHASYAAKVLLKFKLLEVQRISLKDFVQWAETTNYLKLLHRTHFESIAFSSWLEIMIHELQKSGACEISHQVIENR